MDAYKVYRNLNGVVFLRVSEPAGKPRAAKYVVNRGLNVDMVTVPESTSKNFELLPKASVRQTAMTLLHPLNGAVTISEAAKQQLTSILSNKELVMAEAEVKKVKFAAVSPKKAVAPVAVKKSVAPAKAVPAKKKVVVEEEPKQRGRAVKDYTISLAKKQPKNGIELKGHAKVIFDTIEEAGGSLTKSALIDALEERIESKNKLGMADVWAMNRAKLLNNGFIVIEE